MNLTVLIDIGWKNLIGDRIRSVVSLIGVTFGVLLILLQASIYLGFLGSASCVIDHCRGDLWIVKAETVNFETASAFSESVVVRVRGTPGIEWAESLIYSFGELKLPNGARQWAHVVGFDPTTRIGGPWEMVEGNVDSLRRTGTYIVDATSLGRFHGTRVGDRLENFNHEVEIVGMCRGSRACTPNPVVYTSLKTAQNQIPLFNQFQVNCIVAKVAPDADQAMVLQRLRRMKDFDVLTTEEFSQKTRTYWATKTGIGIGNGVTIILGFVVGLVILGQTMYAATMERMKEFAALKILGASNLQICAIIWYQALVMGASGFLISVCLASLLKYAYNDHVVSMQITPFLLGAVALGTVLMCLGASMLSVNRILKVSPAAVFRV